MQIDDETPALLKDGTGCANQNTKRIYIQMYFSFNVYIHLILRFMTMRLNVELSIRKMHQVGPTKDSAIQISYRVNIAYKSSLPQVNIQRNCSNIYCCF